MPDESPLNYTFSALANITYRIVPASDQLLSTCAAINITHSWYSGTRGVVRA